MTTCKDKRSGALLGATAICFTPRAERCHAETRPGKGSWNLTGDTETGAISNVTGSWLTGREIPSSPQPGFPPQTLGVLLGWQNHWISESKSKDFKKTSQQTNPYLKKPWFLSEGALKKNNVWKTGDGNVFSSIPRSAIWGNQKMTPGSVGWWPWSLQSTQDKSKLLLSRDRGESKQSPLQCHSCQKTKHEERERECVTKCLHHVENHPKGGIPTREEPRFIPSGVITDRANTTKYFCNTERWGNHIIQVLDL